MNNQINISNIRKSYIEQLVFNYLESKTLEKISLLSKTIRSSVENHIVRLDAQSKPKNLTEVKSSKINYDLDKSNLNASKNKIMFKKFLQENSYHDLMPMQFKEALIEEGRNDFQINEEIKNQIQGDVCNEGHFEYLLQGAVKTGKLKTVKTLLEIGDRKLFWKSFLYGCVAAIDINNLEIFKYLIESYPNLLENNIFNQLASYSAERALLPFIQLLLEKNQEVSEELRQALINQAEKNQKNKHSEITEFFKKKENSSLCLCN